MAGSPVKQSDAIPPVGETPRSFYRWLWVWHILTYLALAISLVEALLVASHPPGVQAAIGGASLAFAAWYAVAARGRYEVFKDRVWLLMSYMAAGWGLWFLLAGYDPMFNLLLIGLFPQVFGAPPLPWKIIGALILMGLATWRQILSGGHISWTYLIVIGMSTVASIALAWFIHALMIQSQERKRLVEEVKEAQGELAAAERQAGILEERQRLAREIHDTLAQGFTSIIMHLETLDAGISPEQTLLKEHLALARDSARASLAEARRMVWALQPELLERDSLEKALSRYIERWSKESGIEGRLSVTGESIPLPPEYEVALLRTVQEALTNVKRHAQAGSVMVTLSYMEALVALDVQDDGIGFDPALILSSSHEQAGGFGLRSMRERTEILGGTFTVESSAGVGTTIAVALPLSRKES